MTLYGALAVMVTGDQFIWILAIIMNSPTIDDFLTALIVTLILFQILGISLGALIGRKFTFSKYTLIAFHGISFAKGISTTVRMLTCLIKYDNSLYFFA